MTAAMHQDLIVAAVMVGLVGWKRRHVCVRHKQSNANQRHVRIAPQMHPLNCTLHRPFSHPLQANTANAAAPSSHPLLHQIIRQSNVWIHHSHIRLVGVLSLVAQHHLHHRLVSACANELVQAAGAAGAARTHAQARLQPLHDCALAAAIGTTHQTDMRPACSVTSARWRRARSGEEGGGWRLR